MLKEAGGETFETVIGDAVHVEQSGKHVPCASLHALLCMKRAAHRPKDRPAIVKIEKALRGASEMTIHENCALAPHTGWSDFTRSDAVVEIVWEELDGWHYLNLTKGTSIWESPSGRTLYLAFDDEDRIEECVIDLGVEKLEALRERLARELGIVPALDGSD